MAARKSTCVMLPAARDEMSRTLVVPRVTPAHRRHNASKLYAATPMNPIRAPAFAPALSNVDQLPRSHRKAPVPVDLTRFFLHIPPTTNKLLIYLHGIIQ